MLGTVVHSSAFLKLTALFKSVPRSWKHTVGGACFLSHALGWVKGTMDPEMHSPTLRLLLTNEEN